MQKDHKSLNKLFAVIAFVIPFILYLLTIPPTASFWDCSERIACAWGLQIPHPPGTPLYLLLGRIFSMFAPLDYVALSINMMSALASSITIALLYLIIVRFVREFRGHPDSYSTIDKIGMYGGALIGALTFAVTDSHWFTSIEAETYALSLCFTALVVWLVLKWSDNHNMPRNERWLILIAFIFGLAFGVHLLSLLAIFFVGLIIYFRKFEFKFLSFIIAGSLAIGTFFLIFPFTIIQIPTIAGNLEESPLGYIIGPVAFFLIIISSLGFAIYYTQKKKFRTANIILLAYTMILIGYTSFAMIYLRSQTDPAIDQNSPDTVTSFISYLKREQYGTQPILRGYSYDNTIGDINRDNEKLFPRRHSREGFHQSKYAEYDSDWSFFWQYQVGHMYMRYFMWNFTGRDSDVQDAAWYSGFGSTENEDSPANNAFYFIPLFVGLLGMFYHFTKDWKRAFSVLVLFVATGLAIVFYLNQTPFQPRERDYSYTGSFFAFSIWIGLGVTGIVEMIRDYAKSNQTAAIGSLVLLTAALPVLVGSQTYTNNDRSLRYVAPDYAYNLLNSVAPYGILFTNGDNDTFPLWYLQEVEKIRTDVRVVNLSLLNTPWYIKQMKNKWNHDAPPVPISLTDSQIDNIEQKFQFQRQADFWRPRDVRIPVDRELLRGVHEDPQAFSEFGKFNNELVQFTPEMGFQMPVDDLDDEMSWFYEGRFLGQDRSGNDLHYTRVQDDIVMDILRTNQWVRPVYFAITVSRDGQMEMQNYFRLEGKAWRVVPKRVEGRQSMGWLDPQIHGERLKTFRFRETNNEKAYFDENIRRLLDNYRTIFTRQASHYINTNQPDSAAYWLKWGEDQIPFNVVQGDVGSMISYAFRYSELGEHDRAVNIAEQAQKVLNKSFEKGMRNLDRIEEEMNRRSGDRARRLGQQRQSLMRDISFDSSRLIIVQRIYFDAGLDDRALDIADYVDRIVGQDFDFPRTPEDNRRQSDRIFVN